MAKVKVTGLKRLRLQVLKEVDSAMGRPEFLKIFVQDLVNEIKKKGVRPGLEKATIQNRKYLARHNTTGKAYRANKSNMTFTGELLDSITARYIKSKRVFVINAPRVKHKPYNKGSKKTATLREILGHLNKTRPLDSILKRLSKRLIKEIESQFRDLT